MKRQFINFTPPDQRPPVEAPEAAAPYPTGRQGNTVLPPGSPPGAQAARPSLPTFNAPQNEPSSGLAGPAQFKGLPGRSASIAPELAPRRFTDPLPPHIQAQGGFQASAFVQAPPQERHAPQGFAPAPPGFAPAAQSWAEPIPAAQSWAESVPAAQSWAEPAPAAQSWAESAPAAQSWAEAVPAAQSWAEPVAPRAPQMQPGASPWYQIAPDAPPQGAPWQNRSPMPPMPGQPQPYQPRVPHTPPPLPIPPQRRPKKRGIPLVARVALGVLAVLLLIAGGGYTYYQINYARTISNITNQQIVHHNAKGQVITPTPTTADVLTGGRLNILLLGSDTDGKSVPLAQTDIVITIDPQTKYVGMLSIPRDLRLYAPKAGAIKLDEAFATGWELSNTNNYANAVGMSVDTIEQNFGIPINYSAWVGLDGFVKVIDTAGGIDVDVLHPMVDDIYPNDVGNTGGQAYDYKRLYIAPGPQHLDGIHALEYVRTRHSDGQADFGRAVRQQQILSQLKNKLSAIDIAQLPQLIQDLNGHVKTDMQLSDIPKLMNFARGVDPNKIDKLVLSAPYSVPASSVFPKDTSTDYIPVCSQILPKIQQMFDLGNKATCPTVGARYSFPTTAMTGTSGGVSTSPVVFKQPASQTATAAPMTTNTAWQMLSTSSTSPASSLSLSMTTVDPWNSKDPLGVHSLLDLMFMATFENFGAAST